MLGLPLLGLLFCLLFHFLSATYFGLRVLDVVGEAGDTYFGLRVFDVVGEAGDLTTSFSRSHSH